MPDKSIEVVQVLIAPQNTRFVWHKETEIFHLAKVIGTGFSKSYCDISIDTNAVNLITTHEPEVCTECLYAWNKNNPQKIA